MDSTRKSIDQMSDSEKLTELVTKLRMMEDALAQMSNSPMLKTFGFSKLFKQ